MMLNLETELGKRVATGALGAAALLLVVIFGGRLGVGLLTALLSLGMYYEFIEMTLVLPDKREKAVVLLGTTWLIAFVNFWIPRTEFELQLLAFLGLAAYFLITAERHRDREGGGGSDADHPLTQHFKEFVYSIFGLLYLGLIPLFLLLVHDSLHGVRWTVLFFLIVWAGDTGAYFVGKKYGKRKLYYLISPKKTVEGAIGGLLLGYLVTLVFKVATFREMNWLAVLVTPLLVGVAAQTGDLFESFLKRAFHTKDSGSILPGHGGFLDRFDGVVFGLPIMYACVRLFGGG